MLVNQSSKNRNITLDIAKAIAIILVVVGHCIQYGSGNDYIVNEYYFGNFIFKFIYSFHMPLFMIISGYLFCDSIKKYESKVLIKRKVLSLIVPIISYSIIDLILFLVLGKPITLIVVISIITNKLWFIWAVFVMSMIVIINNRFFKDSMVVYILLFLLTLVVPTKLIFHLLAFLYPYFIIGYLFKKYNIDFNKLLNKYIIILSSVVYCVLLYLYNYDTYIYNSGMSIVNNYSQLYVDIVRLLIGLLGSVLVLVGIKTISNSQTIKEKSVLLLNIGKNTLGIYAISNYLLLVLKKITFNLSSINYFFYCLK